MVAETVTFPIDLTKTRIQLHGSGFASGAHRIGAIGVVSKIVKQEGVMGFYKGLSPALIRHLFYTPIRIIGYENLKGFIVKSEANNSESLPLATKALVGGVFWCYSLGNGASFIQMKTRMMNQGEKAVYRNSYDC